MRVVCSEPAQGRQEHWHVFLSTASTSRGSTFSPSLQERFCYCRQFPKEDAGYVPEEGRERCRQATPSTGPPPRQPPGPRPPLPGAARSSAARRGDGARSPRPGPGPGPGPGPARRCPPCSRNRVPRQRGAPRGVRRLRATATEPRGTGPLPAALRPQGR